MDKVKYAIEIVDRWDRPMSKFERRVDRVSGKRIGTFDDVPGKTKRADASVNRLGRSVNTTGQNFDTASQKAGMFSKAMKAGAVIAVGTAAAYTAKKVFDLGEKFVNSAADVEKYETSLKVMLGSQSAARDRMSEYVRIAKETPFELNEVVEAGNQLQAIGRYNEQNLKNLGDLAAASGKPIDQVMNAYAKLSTGQKGEAINMFRDLLISTEDWAEATGSVVKANGELDASTEDMLKALPGILKAKGYYGMMGEQAKTTHGRVSNLADAQEQLSVAIGNRLKPAYDKYVGTATRAVDTMREWVEVPTAQKIAREKAELNSLVGVITDANTGEEERKNMLIELKQQYPELLENIDIETVRNEELRKKLVEVNAQYDKKIRLAAHQSIVNKESKKLQQLEQERGEIINYIDAENAVDDLKNQIERKFSSVMSRDINPGSIVATEDFSGTLKRTAKKLEKKAKETGDFGQYNKFIELKSAYEANASILDEGTTMFSGRSWEKKFEKINKDIEHQQRIVNITEKALTKSERQSLFQRAQAVNLNDTETFNTLFGDKEYQESVDLSKEFDKIRNKKFEEIQRWSRLKSYVEGDLRYAPNSSNDTNNPLDPDEIQKAEATIAGGGRSVKHFNITIESLINENTNLFQEGEDPEDAEEFLDKLTGALQLAVNDVNYANK